MGKEWISLKETGQLYLEKILLTFDIPILFVCKDYENRRYLCLNVDEDTGKTVIAQVYTEQLKDMLEDKVPMEAVFRNAVKGDVIIAEYNTDDCEIVSHNEAAMCMSSDLLPKKGACFELRNDELDEYISYLKKQRIKVDVGSYFTGRLLEIVNVSDAAFMKKFVLNDYKKKNIEHVIDKIVLGEPHENCVYTVNKGNRMIA
ncbi:MAG: hypothetical protein IJ655_06175 [Lachnospiraceae bacterium]|nr:hypothetical protein [Lachnospiraceae bacterium]